MKKYLPIILSSFLMFNPFSIRAEENEKNSKTALPKEEATEVVMETVEEVQQGQSTKKSLLKSGVNFISRIPETKKDRYELKKLNYLEGFGEALIKEYQEDPLFYAGRGDLIDENQNLKKFMYEGKMLNALWDVSVANSKLLSKGEDYVLKIKDKITWKPKIKNYRFKINPEIDDKYLLEARIRICTENKILDGWEIKGGLERISLDNCWILKDVAEKKMSLEAGFYCEWDRKLIDEKSDASLELLPLETMHRDYGLKIIFKSIGWPFNKPEKDKIKRDERYASTDF